MRSSQEVRQILKTTQNKYIWVELLIWGGGGVHEGDTILIWGYAEGYNTDLGVREYQKVENLCYRDPFPKNPNVHFHMFHVFNLKTIFI